MCIYIYTCVYHVNRTSCAQMHNCNKAIVVITGRAHCFHDCIYIYIFIFTENICCCARNPMEVVVFRKHVLILWNNYSNFLTLKVT